VRIANRIAECGGHKKNQREETIQLKISKRIQIASAVEAIVK
jgi:hypothetical protein